MSQLTWPSRSFSRRDFLVYLSASFAAAGTQGRLARSDQPEIFRDAASEVGLNFRHFTGATGEFLMPEIMGAGLALFDYDNDGALDVYLLQGTMLDPHKSPARSLFPPSPGRRPGNRLFHNDLKRTGKLHFTDVTEQAGVGHVGYGMGIAVADYDNDGLLDLYVTNFGPNVLYHNNGDGTFTDVTRTAGTEDSNWSTSAAWVDYDRDGNLDLFVANYLDFTALGNKRCYNGASEIDYCTPKMYRPVSARLFHNLGNGKFVDVTEESGIGSALGPGLGVACADFDGDGWPDIYVANDTAANHLWLNQHNGIFKEAGLLSGTAFSVEGAPQAGMGVAIGDIGNRGIEDILVTNLTHEGAVLYRNNGKGSFTDETAAFGLLQPTFPFTGFGTQFFDYDNDGWLDLFIANGAVTKMGSLRDDTYPFHQRNQLFHNEQGHRFREVSDEAGPVFRISHVSRGAAFGDIDNDGSLEIVVSNNNGPVQLLLNRGNAHTRNHWLQVRLEQPRRNRFAIGAKIFLQQGRRTLSRRVHTDSSYLSANDVRVHFGLGDNPGIDRLTVEWPDGVNEVWDKVSADNFVVLQRGTGRAE
jgi:hypothetical protein